MASCQPSTSRSILSIHREEHTRPLVLESLRSAHLDNVLPNYRYVSWTAFISILAVTGAIYHLSSNRRPWFDGEPRRSAGLIVGDARKFPGYSRVLETLGASSERNLKYRYLLSTTPLVSHVNIRTIYFHRPPLRHCFIRSSRLEPTVILALFSPPISDAKTIT